MHNSSFLRMKWFEANYASKMVKNKLSVLDVGSYDVNGSYKNIFSSGRYHYYGLDMEKGPNVDIVLDNPYCWNSVETNFYDIVISGQAFEHIEFFWVTIAEMVRVLNKGGLLCIIAPNGFKEHRYPVDCYRFFTDGMVALARYVCLDILHAHTNCAPEETNHDWFSEDKADSMLIATKNYASGVKHVDLNTYVCVPSDHKNLRSEFFPFNRNSA